MRFFWPKARSLMNRSYAARYPRSFRRTHCVPSNAYSGVWYRPSTVSLSSISDVRISDWVGERGDLAEEVGDGHGRRIVRVHQLQQESPCAESASLDIGLHLLQVHAAEPVVAHLAVGDQLFESQPPGGHQCSPLPLRAGGDGRGYPLLLWGRVWQRTQLPEGFKFGKTIEHDQHQIVFNLRRHESGVADVAG